MKQKTPKLPNYWSWIITQIEARERMILTKSININFIILLNRMLESLISFHFEH